MLEEFWQWSTNWFTALSELTIDIYALQSMLVTVGQSSFDRITTAASLLLKHVYSITIFHVQLHTTCIHHTIAEVKFR